MHDRGYIAIDTELGGPGYFKGNHSILEIAMLPFPDPTGINMKPEEFIRTYITAANTKFFIIKPYAPVQKQVLEEVVKKPLSHYETNGSPVGQVAEDIVKLLRGLNSSYSKIVPVADWHGDVTALEYLTSVKGVYLTDIMHGHNMLHIKSFVKGKFGGSMAFDAQKEHLGIKLVRNHQADQDCMEIAELTVRALLRKRETKNTEQNRKKQHS